MLCQLVCVDRRYQRMNCFNIREVQSLLKRKFFTDLINTHDHHTLLNKTTVGTRFKTNNINAIQSNMFVFYNYGLELTVKIRNEEFVSFTDLNALAYNTNSIFFNIIEVVRNSSIFFFFNTTTTYILYSMHFITGPVLGFKSAVNAFLTFVLSSYYYGFIANLSFLISGVSINTYTTLC